MCGVRLVATCHFVPILLSGKILFPSARDPLNHLQHNNSRRQTTAAPARSNAQHPVVMAANAYTKSMSHTDTATQISYAKSSYLLQAPPELPDPPGKCSGPGPVRPPGRLAVGPPIHAAAQRLHSVHTQRQTRGQASRVTTDPEMLRSRLHYICDHTRALRPTEIFQVSLLNIHTAFTSVHTQRQTRGAGQRGHN